jgi:hypothetical protein
MRGQAAEEAESWGEDEPPLPLGGRGELFLHPASPIAAASSRPPPRPLHLRMGRRGRELRRRAQGSTAAGPTSASRSRRSSGRARRRRRRTGGAGGVGEVGSRKCGGRRGGDEYDVWAPHLLVSLEFEI